MSDANLLHLTGGSETCRSKIHEAFDNARGSRKANSENYQHLFTNFLTICWDYMKNSHFPRSTVGDLCAYISKQLATWLIRSGCTSLVYKYVCKYVWMYLLNCEFVQNKYDTTTKLI